MNKTDRLLAIVLELQARGRQRAEDLAATFETSKRTIYRDVQALCEAGVPLISVPGQGYSLMKGYFLPPLSFTTEEATMLLLGAGFIANFFDAQYRAAAQSANRKIASVLPEKLQEEVRYLQDSIYFVPFNREGDEAQQVKLQLVRGAIIDHHTLRFRYHTRHSSDGQSPQHPREADPYGLAFFAGAWHLIAHDHTRQSIRNFRFDRMEELEVLNQTFQRPADYMAGKRPPDTRDIVVRVLFDKEVARWVQEARSFFVTEHEETPDGLLVTLKIKQESEILNWLLSWGGHARILEPEALRNLIVEHARRMLERHQYADLPQL